MEERLCCLPSCTELLNGNTEILRCMVFLVIQYSVEHGDHNLDASLTASVEEGLSRAFPG